MGEKKLTLPLMKIKNNNNLLKGSGYFVGTGCPFRVTKNVLELGGGGAFTTL